MSILLAEDNRINRLFLEKSLKEAGHHVTVVNDGREAYEAVLSGDHFDLVLMDVRMPIMDGHVTKPVDRENLAAEIRKVVRFRETD